MIPKSYEHEFVSFIERNGSGGYAFVMAPRLSHMETIMDRPGERRAFRHYLDYEEILWTRHDEEIAQIEADPYRFPDGGDTSAADLRRGVRYDLEMEFGAKINWHREYALAKGRGKGSQ
jgi:hypothetical protein